MLCRPWFIEAVAEPGLFYPPGDKTSLGPFLTETKEGSKLPAIKTGPHPNDYNKVDV